MQQGGRRERLALIAGAIVTTFASGFVFLQKWGEKNPYILTILGLVATVLYLGYAITSPAVASLTATLRNRHMQAIIVFVSAGAVVGGALGWLALIAIHANKAHLKELAMAERVLPTAAEIADAVAKHEPRGLADISVIPAVRAIQPSVRQAHRDPDGRVRLGLGPVSTTMTMRYALLATFRNEPTAERPTRNARNLTAFVTLGDPTGHASGFWLESFSRTISLDQGEEASVLVAFVIENEHARLVNINQKEDVVFWSCSANGKCPSKEFIATVKLMEGGRLLVEAEYRVILSSQQPEIALVQQTRPPEAARASGAAPASANISTADARICWLVERGSGYVEWDTTLTEKEFENATQAVAVAFRNDSMVPIQKIRAEVYCIEPTTMQRERTGCATWIGENLNTVSLAARESKELVVALYDDAVMFSVNDNRRDVGSTGGCTKRPLPFAKFIAWIELSVLDTNDQLVGEIEERVGVEIKEDSPSVQIIGPPGAIIGKEPHSIAEISVVCDEWYACIEVTNRGEGALFSATLAIKGPVKTFRTQAIYCQWAHTLSVEARIAKGQTCRLTVADRRRDTGMAVARGFSWWVIHALADGHPVEIESTYHSTPFSVPPAAADDIVVDVEIIASPDFSDGIERARVTLGAFKAVAG